MKIQPWQHLLEVWEAVVHASFKNKKWEWTGSAGLDSVAEAQQLLCLMFPATERPRLRLERPNETDEAVLDALTGIGGAIEIPLSLTRVLTAYMTRHADKDGNPTFSGGNYFTSLDDGREPSTRQRRIEVTESYALSITLTLAVLGFGKTFRQILTREKYIEEVLHLESLASKRLTSALIGLLRSFSVYTFDANGPEGRVRTDMLRQGSGKSHERIVDELRNRMEDIASGLRDLKIGSGGAVDLEGTGRLFECGWSWGIVKDAPVIEGFDDFAPQHPGFADDAPYLYFTTVALDGIADLYTRRTRVLGLLDDEQSRLAQALQLRWDLTQRYWAQLATFGEDRWPLEDPPWRTTDNVGSDYFSLMVSAIATRDMVERRASDEDLSRLGRVLAELAERNRITRRPGGSQRAISMHYPGFRAHLDGASTDKEPRLSWTNMDFSAVLLKRTIGIAALIRDVRQRAEVLSLAGDLWSHLSLRRISTNAGRNLWDEPANTFPGLDHKPSGPSWQQTIRVVESLVAAAKLVDMPPPRSDAMAVLAQNSLAEAEHLYDQELLRGGSESARELRDTLLQVNADLTRVRKIVEERPASAVAIIQAVLRNLDRLAAARQGTD